MRKAGIMTIDHSDKLDELYARAQARHTTTLPAPTAPACRRVRVAVLMPTRVEWPDIQAYAHAHSIPLIQSRDIEPGTYLTAFTSRAGYQQLLEAFKRGDVRLT